MDQPVLGKVLSRDNTVIAYERVGDGPALLLVHGTGSDSSRWSLVLPQLAEHFTVYLVNRRGRGCSGDGEAYTIEREYEDIQAVAAAAGGPVDILGHSFGAACILGAAPRIANLRRLILYEPPMLQEQYSPQREEILRRMDESLSAGDRETVVTILTHEMLRVPMPVLERMRSTPAWAVSVAAAHTIPRELRVSSAYGAVRDDLKILTVPTLFLSGSDSPETFKATMDVLCTLLPDSQIVVLPGQQHSAMLTAPELFAREVIRFLS